MGSAVSFPSAWVPDEVPAKIGFGELESKKSQFGSIVNRIFVILSFQNSPNVLKLSPDLLYAFCVGYIIMCMDHASRRSVPVCATAENRRKPQI